MNKNDIRKLMAALAAAGCMMAGSINSHAQSTTPSSPPPPDKRDTDRKGSADSGSTNTPAPMVPPGTRPVPVPPPDAPPPANGMLVPILLPAPNGTPSPLPPSGSISSDGRVIVPPPSGGAGNSGSIPPVPPSGTVPRDVKPAKVTLAGVPATPMISGQTVPANPQAGSTRVEVFSGDIVRPVPTAGVPAPTGGTNSPVIALVQQFDAQRTQELTARAAQLEQLRTATPDQRAALIADLQAAAQRQAGEQREAARELRSEMRTLREERKGK